MAYVAIDFETANARRSSVCALGVVRFDASGILSSAAWLIRPPVLEFDPYNTFIHGITPEMVENEPEFHQLWPTILDRVQGAPLVAHNASFDMSCLRAVLAEYGLPFPELRYFCTRVISKRVWPQMVSYSLPIVAERLGIEFEHHNAEQDAAACAVIAQHACKATGFGSLEELAERTSIRPGELFQGGYRPCSLAQTRPTAAADASFDPDHPLFGRTVVFTGTLQSMVRNEAMHRVVDVGGICGGSVTSATNLLVLGDLDFRKLKGGTKSSKLKKAESLIAAGADLELIPEREFLEMLGEVPRGRAKPAGA